MRFKKIFMHVEMEEEELEFGFQSTTSQGCVVGILKETRTSPGHGVISSNYPQRTVLELIGDASYHAFQLQMGVDGYAYSIIGQCARAVAEITAEIEAPRKKKEAKEAEEIEFLFGDMKNAAKTS